MKREYFETGFKCWTFHRGQKRCMPSNLFLPPGPNTLMLCSAVMLSVFSIKLILAHLDKSFAELVWCLSLHNIISKEKGTCLQMFFTAITRVKQPISYRKVDIMQMKNKCIFSISLNIFWEKGICLHTGPADTILTDVICARLGKIIWEIVWDSPQRNIIPSHLPPPHLPHNIISKEKGTCLQMFFTAITRVKQSVSHRKVVIMQMENKCIFSISLNIFEKRAYAFKSCFSAFIPDARSSLLQILF